MKRVVILFMVMVLGLSACTARPVPVSLSESETAGNLATESEVTDNTSGSTAAGITTSETESPRVTDENASLPTETSTASTAAQIVVPDFPIYRSDSIAPAISAAEFHTVRIHYGELFQTLSVDLPGSWAIEPSSVSKNIFDISRDSENIGKIIVDMNWYPEATMKQLSSENTGDIYMQKRQYTYADGQISITHFLIAFEGTTSYRIEVDANEIDDTSMGYIRNSIQVRSDIAKTDGALLDKSNAHILILGNSFVASSQIGEILQLMVDKEQNTVNVDADSRGYYSVKLYTEDTALMESIRAGTYDVVFLCGFYSSSDVSSLPIFVTACEKGNASLVATPAYNEADSCIQAAITNHEEMALANWKALIYELVDSGISSSYLCMDDQYKHTTVIGGYAGACLLYSMLFGEKPPSVYEEVLSLYPEIYQYGISQSKAESMFQSIEKITYDSVHQVTPAYEIQ